MRGQKGQKRWREREETGERTEKRPRTDTDTDVESTQSRQKKGQMKYIFLNDSAEEAIVEFVKQHEELYYKTHMKFKDKQSKEGLWERLGVSRNLSVNTVKNKFKSQHARYGKLTHTKSGKPGCETVLAFWEVTSEGRECLNLPRLSHH